MADNSFFEEVREQSQIKARIVSKYFWAWANVVIPTAKKQSNRIAYIDLFAGPGRYEDGAISTPLMILQQAIQNPVMREMLVTVFNDQDGENAGKLLAAIEALPGIGTLKYKPQISNKVVGDDIATMFGKLKLVPTFFFVDPWGYKGLSLGLINAVLQNWGCDCVFFFNYNRVNMGLNNDAVKEHMDCLFGRERAGQLRNSLLGLSPADRESLIIEELANSLKSSGGSFVLPFAFKDATGTRTKHHLVFVTKNFKGYEIMKDIMAKESSEQLQGVASFEYSPASEQFPTLFDLTRPLDDLAEMLLKEFSGETSSMINVYTRHSVGKPYIKRNYKHALTQLESQGRVIADPPASKRPKKNGEVTFGDNVTVIFPAR